MTDDRLIVALDFPTMAEAKDLVLELGDTVSYYKVGMELFYSAGPETVLWLKENNKKVFLDLKLHDIPNTVAGGLCSLMSLGADMMNVHTQGGYTMMNTAMDRLRKAAEEAGRHCPDVIGVTILTSIGEDDWSGLGETETISDKVIRLARLSQSAGLSGVVASPVEAENIRRSCGKDFMIVTPGIRPAGSDKDDQSRIATPSAALHNGATHLVIGRPIRSAADPKGAALKIINEMQS